MKFKIVPNYALIEMDLHGAIKDINTILELVTLPKNNLVSEDQVRIYDAKKRVAIILLVTAWETYVEETIKNEFRSKLRKSNGPIEFKEAIKLITQSKYKSGINYDDVLKWAGEGWKYMVKSQFEYDLAKKKFNTPNAAEIGKLFSHYLNIKIKKWWVWKGMPFDKVDRKLQLLIEYRGEFAHRSLSQMREFGYYNHSISMRKVNEFMKFIPRLALCISNSLGYKRNELDI